MSSLTERIETAVEALTAGFIPKGTIREQGEFLLGTKLDDEALHILESMAMGVSKDVAMALIGKADLVDVAVGANVSVLLAGMALGKRLGVEEGEDFARMTASFLPTGEGEDFD